MPKKKQKKRSPNEYFKKRKPPKRYPKGKIRRRKGQQQYSFQPGDRFANRMKWLHDVEPMLLLFSDIDATDNTDEVVEFILEEFRGRNPKKGVNDPTWAVFVDLVVDGYDEHVEFVESFPGHVNAASTPEDFESFLRERLAAFKVDRHNYLLRSPKLGALDLTGDATLFVAQVKKITFYVEWETKRAVSKVRKTGDVKGRRRLATRSRVKEAKKRKKANRDARGRFKSTSRGRGRVRGKKAVPSKARKRVKAGAKKRKR